MKLHRALVTFGLFDLAFGQCYVSHECKDRRFVGRNVYSNGRAFRVNAYFSIPYARIARPFEKAEKIERFNSLEAYNIGPACYQKSYTTDPGPLILGNDCLTLNIFMRIRTATNASLPVVVLFHGGAFMASSGMDSLYSGRVLAETANCVVVTFNYRLGVYGFSILDRTIHGNLGLFDQRLALEWIQDHIECFGGNPNNVMLMGTGAGAVSIIAHLFSSLNEYDPKPLFHSIWVDSGVLGSVYIEPQAQQTEFLRSIKNLGCQTNQSTHDILKCVRAKLPERVVHDVARSLLIDGEPTLPFVPTRDGEFLTSSNEDYLQKGDCFLCQKVDIFIGHIKDEGHPFATNGFSSAPIPTKPIGTAEEFIREIEHAARLNNFRDSLKSISDESLRTKILETYYDEDQPGDSILKFIGDGVYNCPIHDFINSLQRKSDRVYKYIFEPSVDDMKMKKIHLSAWIYLTGSVLDLGKVVDPALARHVVEITGFFGAHILRRNSDGKPLFRQTEWPNFKTDTHRYLLINERETKVVEELFDESRCSSIFKIPSVAQG